jgi:orotidine-5'-phosphate decarboxylase
MSEAPRPAPDDSGAAKLIAALDVPSAAAAIDLADRLRAYVGCFKIGLELFSAEGPPLVHELVRRGNRVFLDLKLHDIPNTVRGAAREAARLGVTMFTVHAAGGRGMMTAAAEGAREGAGDGQPPLVLGVTVLTSLTNADLTEIGWNESSLATATRLARLAHASGLGGVVASPHEAAFIRQNLGAGFAIVTPGIRPAASARHDQARSATPQAAIRAGADFLVVGRPITQAADPAAAASAIADEITKALAARKPEASHGRP